MINPTSVVDASVALKWALDDEECVPQALALRDDCVHGEEYELVAPSLLYYEIINGMCTAVRRGRIVAETGGELVEHLLSLGIRLVDPESSHIYQVASRFRITAYDAAYLALAEALGCVLWTGDRAFVRATTSLTSRVRWIGDYP